MHSIYWGNTTNYVRLLAGVPGYPDHKDGDPSLVQVQFNEPSLMVFDSKGRMYIADTGNGAIRTIDLQ